MSARKHNKNRDNCIKVSPQRQIPLFNATSRTSPYSDTKNIKTFDKTQLQTCFPFEWAYATIIELSEEEKHKINPSINNIGHKRKQHFRHCQLCGDQGVIEFRKVSDGNSSLLCRSCAEKYARKAITLFQKIERYRSYEKN